MKINEQTIEEKMKKDLKIGRRTLTKVALGAVAVGSVYMLGASKGLKIGYSRGRLVGYSEATHDIAEMLRQTVDAKSE
jgi:hypothetical protein